MLIDDSNATTHTVTQGEVIVQISSLYDLIGQRLGSLPGQLNTTRGDDTDSDYDDSATEASHVSSNSDTRRENTLDILSTFDRKMLPREYSKYLANSPPATASGRELLVPGNLASTIYRIAIRDETFYRRLRKVVSQDICADVYFSKQMQGAKGIILSLDQPVENRMPVGECANRLRYIVHQLCESRDSRASREPLGAEVISKLAEILVDILHEVVCNRNKNVHEKLEDGEHERDRNLYTYLIGDPPKPDESAPFGLRDFFIIDRLFSFPVNEWKHLLERLTTISEHVRENEEDQPSSRAYLMRLNELIRGYNEDYFEPSLSSWRHRRPTIDSPRESQRMRVD